ncbi:MAG: phosphatase PAP2 family protein [Alphaproteobacteria bacterium]|nr:phosphatase PAP2 family protein [Alphaproteobacteria bacterium]MBV9370494.1 phosphatase PAP2 family protein [Alphaproteobacteria bacterium]MBV9901395.1 phosphatase PAP2 family protein [Alphaproteobacteria bacterium]
MDRFRPWLLISILAALWVAMLFLGGPASDADGALAGLFHVPALVPAARLLTHLGDWTILLPLTLAGAAALVFLRSPRAGILYLILILGGRLLVEFEKAAIGRARPDESGRLVEVASLSYPSGHAAYSTMTWLGFALLAVSSPRLRAPAVALALVLAGLVGLTRLVLAVHWPSDVIGGWAFGAGWTLLLVRLAGGTRARQPH